ncbi:MAG: GGDEF domain-containing protein [Planctomycetota bacterium]|jgi:diguanylate cyclase (GGDEF)-like protein/PAS domain S-box-containing protein
MSTLPRGADNPAEVAPAGDAAAGGLPHWFAWAVGIICALPLLLYLFGADLAQSAPPPAIESLGPASLADAMHGALAGSFTHALLEWSAFCAALVTAVLAYIHFRMTGDVTTPVIGIALLGAGCMDAFHTLAAVRLLDGGAAPTHLIPFTWTLSRLFAAVIMVSGVGLLLLHRRESLNGQWFVLGAGAAFVGVSYIVIQLCAASPQLPRTMFPASFVTRPYDVVPLVLFAFVAAPLFYLFHRRHRSLFSHALLISLIPDIAAQAFLAFGSTALYDASFNIAHALKIVAYGVPLVGLMLEYERAFKARLRADEALRQSEQRFDLAVQGTSDGLWDWDLQTNEVWYAARFKELLGYKESEFPNVLESLNSHLHPDDYHWTWKAVDDHLERGEPFDVEYRLRTKTEEYRWFRARAIAVRDQQGQPVRMAGSIQDITDRKEVIEQLEGLSQRLAQVNTEIAVDARIDPLTKVLNRSSWEEGIAIEDERSCRHGHLYGVMIIDIDHFKQFNDTAGHMAGDDCLRAVVDCVCRTCRLTDVVGRYGGDEFMVLLPETDLPSSKRAAERVLEMVQARTIRHEGLGEGACVTISIGVAQGPSSEGWKTVLERADEALYRAKNEGKNRIEVSETREAA